MPIERDELLRLIRRDHRELEMALMELATPDLTPGQRRTILDGVRLGLECHGAAEDIVVYPAFGRLPSTPRLHAAISDARSAHAELDGLLARLMSTPCDAPCWRDLVAVMRRKAEAHAAREERELLPSLRAGLAADVYRALAGEFATERLRQLSMMQPSAPIAMPLELMSG